MKNSLRHKTLKRVTVKYSRRDKPPHVKEQVQSWPIDTSRRDTRKEIELFYKGKKSADEILSHQQNVQLEEVGSFGQMHLHRTPNLLIEGENFAVLPLLLNDKQIAGRVRQIYIDPPFSTRQEFRIGNKRTSTVSAANGDPVAYEDKLSGSQFLEFLRERLILLRELLAIDGTIYLHIDCKIGHYVKILMDEIFGPEHFINDITRVKCNPKNFSRKGYGNIKDMILFYSKSDEYVWNEPRTEMTEDDIRRLFSRVDETGRRYTTTPLHAPGETRNGDTGKRWNGLLPPPGRHWRVSRKELARLEKLNLIEWSKSRNPRKKIYADEILAKGKKLQDVWQLKDPPYPKYPTEKNLQLLKQIIRASSNHGDIVLDCFAGSGTTLVAAELAGRRWIGIDESRAAIRTCLTRLQEIEHVSEFTHSRAR